MPLNPEMPGNLPEIVLLPGLDGTGDLFARLERQLEGHARATVVRYPADPKMSYRDYKDFALSKIGRRRVVLLGESFSGPVSVMIAAERPDLVRGLILSATFLRNPHFGWLMRRASNVNPGFTPNILRRRILMGRFADDALDKQVYDIVETMPPGIRARRLVEVSRIDVREEFAKITCPVLALHGDADCVVFKGPMARAIASKRNAAMRVLAGAHLLLQTRAEAATREILKFVTSLPE